MRISAIAALDSKRALGKNNQLLFHIPADFVRMKELTSGYPIIMGRKTFESIGRVLPNRTNIIITRDTTFQYEGAVVVHSLDEALKKAEATLATNYQLPTTENEVFIFGGGQIFAEALPQIGRLYLTLVDHDFQGDTFFPDYSEFTKVVAKEERHDWEYPYTFLTLEKA